MTCKNILLCIITLTGAAALQGMDNPLHLPEKEISDYANAGHLLHSSEFESVVEQLIKCSLKEYITTIHFDDHNNLNASLKITERSRTFMLTTDKNFSEQSTKSNAETYNNGLKFLTSTEVTTVIKMLQQYKLTTSLTRTLYYKDEQKRTIQAGLTAVGNTYTLSLSIIEPVKNNKN